MKRSERISTEALLQAGFKKLPKPDPAGHTLYAKHPARAFELLYRPPISNNPMGDFSFSDQQSTVYFGTLTTIADVLDLCDALKIPRPANQSTP